MSETSGTSDLKLSWLSKTFLEKVLKTSEQDDDIQVTKYDFGRATADGDNYTSVMYRVKVHYTTRGHSHSRSFVIKTLPTAELMAQMVKEGKVFERESEAISKITPSVYDILRKAPGDQNSQQPFAAKCIYSQLEYPDIIIVLEDLKEQGFRMPERTEGLEMDHCLLVLRTLAKYHAATAVLYEQNPELFEPFKENMFKEKDKDKWNKFYSGTINNLVSKIKNMPNFEEHFKIQLEKIETRWRDFNVFAHGDLWLNNIMFRYSESTGQVQDIR
ncbi:hypothetical protein L9F63_028013 [Diploptera punctata]|uniref:CHK kinase-like domain-containing protein n=1 Tax=Diploptera punctata TaxID=6984 RepID=A0AAD7ZYQ8_DIPPU|nr:hypothetical protein L9F63_028013 [Diploptera punctata]